MADDRKAKLAEIEETARQAGFDLVMAYRPTLEKNVHNGQIPEDVNDAIMAETSAKFQSMCAEQRIGATGKEIKFYQRGLHAGMKKGFNTLFLPYLDAKGSG